eukprot:Lankesteria_metandrocarpae@DN5336_c1_g3_i5.p1
MSAGGKSLPMAHHNMAGAGAGGGAAIHSGLLRGKGGGSVVGRRKMKTTSSKSSKAGLNFPVGRIGRYLKDGRYAPRIGVKASVFLAAVLEYLCTEVLDLAANEAKDAGRARISPRHIQLAVRNDEELNILLGAVTIASGGVIPQVNPVLYQKKAKSPNKKGSSKSASSGSPTGAGGGYNVPPPGSGGGKVSPMDRQHMQRAGVASSGNTVVTQSSTQGGGVMAGGGATPGAAPMYDD